MLIFYTFYRFLLLQWDKKITTLPGLYILSAIFLLPFKQCSTFALRLTSLFASIVNVCLIFEIRRCLQQKVRIDLFLAIIDEHCLFSRLWREFRNIDVFARASISTRHHYYRNLKYSLNSLVNFLSAGTYTIFLI